MPPSKTLENTAQRRDDQAIHSFHKECDSSGLAAGHDTSPESRQALAELCQKYWPPLYAFVRRKNYRVEDAQDITQGFFALFLERGCVKDATPERGKFRAYLLTAMKHYMANERRRAQTQKRGGGRPILSLDFDSAEGSYRLEPVDELTPDKVYERRWAMTLLSSILAQLGEEYAGAGRSNLFEKLGPLLTGEETGTPYRELAAELEMTEGAVKVAVHRLRRRFADLLRKAIAQTVADNDEIEQEIEHLFSVFR